MGFFSLAFPLLLVRDVGLLSLSAFKKGAGLILERKPKGFSQSKRRFLTQVSSVGILGGAVLLTGYGFFRARQRPRISRVSVPFSGLPSCLEGLTIAQISDLHVGPTLKREFVEGVVEQVNALNADIIVFTGDLVDGSVPDLRHHVAPLKELKAPLGSFFVTGNHEYYSGVMPWIQEAKRIGFQVLINENKILSVKNQKILLAGVTDYSGGAFYPTHRSDPQAALKSETAPALKILLAHQPKSIFQAAKAGFDLQLSGHTHGGQYLPWKYLVSLSQPFTAGLHKFQKTWIYVNRGTGYWGPPLRIGVPSEITLLSLKST